MASWDDGYVTDVVYTDSVYREMTPAWLGFAALLLGQRHPDLSRRFRYADLGCGFGMTALVVAATCPQAEVWGFDFNPAHIETARRWAADLGLSNVTFEETSFATLAQLPDTVLPDFDFIVSHGVLSWISPANRQHLIDVIGRRLLPGGLAYLSYNTLTGWASMVPVRALMRQLAMATPGRSDQSVPAVLDTLDRVVKGGARYFAGNPGLTERLTQLRNQSPRYVAHEYLNADWHPVMSSDVITSMQEARCGYLGSAALAENIDIASIPAELVPLLAETREPLLRETLRDFAMGRMFRRDIYRRGLLSMSTAEHLDLLDGIRFIRTSDLPENEITFTTPMGTLSGRAEVYQPLLGVLRQGPATVAELRRASPARPVGEILQALTLLASGGFVHPMMPDPVGGLATSQALNRRFAQANGDGADMPRLAAPAIGSIMSADVIETLVVGRLLDGAAEDVTSLADAVIQSLQRAGRSLRREGKVLEDPVEVRQQAEELVRGVLGPRVALLRSLGCLPG
jgi:ubiquinone/menaquinone biosynthesis C-methylase UbiE